MTTTLSTNWLRIGRSGDTVDGRVIPAVALTQAAETYNPELYTALIWLEHQRFGGHLGKVLALKSAPNEENGVDLFAQLSPNRNYLAENSIYQEGWFSSMELTNDFRKTGKWYLSGLGATNEPASVATTEIRFAKIAEKSGEFLGAYLKTETKQFPDDRKESYFKFFDTFFSNYKMPETNNMSDKNYLQLKQELDVVKDQLEKFTKEKPAETPEQNADVTRLTQENADLKAQIETFKANEATRTTEFTALKTQVESLSTTLAAALAEQSGTPTPQNLGGGRDTENLA